ncbi:MAG: histidine phosphatase family protein [Saprospiraceae bacterium]
MSKLVFIRHAQASFMSADYDNLSNFGIEQSKSLGRYFEKEGIRFDKVFVGPLKRHKQTYDYSTEYLPQSDKNIPIIIDGLKEHNGPEALKVKSFDLEKMYPQVIEWRKEMQDNPKLKYRNSLRIFRLFMADWMDEKIIVDHPSVIPYSQWKQGVENAINTIFNSLDGKENVAVYTSGGTIGSVIGLALGVINGRTIANLNDSIRNTSLSYFFYSKRGFNVLSFNEIPHLTTKQITFV